MAFWNRHDRSNDIIAPEEIVSPLVAYANEHIGPVRERFVAGIPELQKEVFDELKRDRDSFSIRLNRFGDFLAMIIHRGFGDPVKGSESANLQNTKRIKLIEGKCPTIGSGSARFVVGKIHNSDSLRIFDLASSRLDTTPGNTGRYIFERDRFNDDFFQSDGHYFHRDNAMIKQMMSIDGSDVSSCPSYAVSDQIHFVGTDLSLSIPFGLGQSVYDQIHEELQRGYEPSKIEI